MNVYILKSEEGTVRVKSEAAARRVARDMLGVPRVSEYPTEKGWVYYPTGDFDDDGPIVTVTVL